MVLSLPQVRAQTIWRELTYPLHQKLHRSVFGGSILALIGAIDPHNQYRIYPWYILGFMKDHMTVLMLYV
jgi:hypothetical protein